MFQKNQRAFRPLRARSANVRAFISAAVLAAGAMSLACNGDSPPELELPRLEVLILSPAAIQLGPGQTQALQLIGLDQFGNPYNLSGLDLIWTTDDEQVATVAGDAEAGLVTARSAGSTVVHVQAEDLTGDVFVQVLAPPTEVTIAVRNELVEPIAVTVNGVHRLYVAAGEIGKTRAPIGQPFHVAWSLVRPTSAAGVELGEPLAETFPTVSHPEQWMTFVVDAEVGDIRYFTPRVMNTSGEDLLIGVNMGLPSENRCDCVVPDGGEMSLGYYPLLSGANVRGYAVDQGYTEALCEWEDLQFRVDRESGRVVLSVPDDTDPTDLDRQLRPVGTP